MYAKRTFKKPFTETLPPDLSELASRFQHKGKKLSNVSVPLNGSKDKIEKHLFSLRILSRITE